MLRQKKGDDGRQAWDDLLDSLAGAKHPRHRGDDGATNLTNALIFATRCASTEHPRRLDAQIAMSELVDTIGHLIGKKGVKHTDVVDAVNYVVKIANLTDGLPLLCTEDRGVYRKALELHDPKTCPRVADVGGGTGALSVALRDAGYDVTLMDPRAPRIKGITTVERKFLVRDAEDFDLLVGVRPCSAGPKLVRAAKRRPLVFTPCDCPHHWPKNSATLRSISTFFRSTGVRFRRDRRLFWTGQSPASAPSP